MICRIKRGEYFNLESIKCTLVVKKHVQIANLKCKKLFRHKSLKLSPKTLKILKSQTFIIPLKQDVTNTNNIFNNVIVFSNLKTNFSFKQFNIISFLSTFIYLRGK